MFEQSVFDSALVCTAHTFGMLTEVKKSGSEKIAPFLYINLKKLAPSFTGIVFSFRCHFVNKNSRNSVNQFSILFYFCAILMLILPGWGDLWLDGQGEKVESFFKLISSISLFKILTS